MKDGPALILDAAAFAADKHRNQRRKDKGASPYINHPVAVASAMSEPAAMVKSPVLSIVSRVASVPVTPAPAAGRAVPQRQGSLLPPREG